MYTKINEAMYEYQLARAKLIKLMLEQNSDIKRLSHYLAIMPKAMEAVIKGAIDGTYPVKPQ